MRAIGPDAPEFLNAALVSDLAKVQPGRAKYTLMVTAEGGVIDDLIVYRIEDSEYLLIPNASNRERVVAELEARASGFDVEIWDETEGSA